MAVRALDLQHNLETATLLAIVIGCLLAAPSRPLAGPTGYALLSYTFGRDDTVTTTLMNLGGTSIVAALSVAAAVVWWRRHGGRRDLGRRERRLRPGLAAPQQADQQAHPDKTNGNDHGSNGLIITHQGRA